MFTSDVLKLTWILCNHYNLIQVYAINTIFPVTFYLLNIDHKEKDFELGILI